MTHGTDDGTGWLVVGLGNPEADYGGTRHNIGADAVRELARRHHVELGRNKRIRCEAGETTIGGHRVAMVVPQSYMNTSGAPVQSAARWFDAPVEQLIVLHDELDLDVGSLRTKQGGGAGGHNGLKDIDRSLGSREYLRVRIGIGKPPGRQPGADYVLRRPPPREREELDVAIQHAVDCVEVLVTEGLAEAQNRFNGLGRSTG